MDVYDGTYVNATGKSNIFSKVGKGFVKKDAAGKSKLTTGGKIAAGALAIGISALTASALKKNKPGQLNEEPYDSSEMPSSGGTPGNQPGTQPGGQPGGAAGSGSGSGAGGGNKNNTMLYVGIGVGVLAIVGIIIYATKKQA